MAVNSAVFQGRMVRDGELKQTQGGINFMNFTIAWSEKHKEMEVKCFLRCKAWRQTAEFINKYLNAKGTEMLVEGRLETEEWTDKEGKPQSMTVLNVSRAHFCGKRQDAQTEPATTGTAETAAPAGFVPADDENLPF